MDNNKKALIAALVVMTSVAWLTLSFASSWTTISNLNKFNTEKSQFDWKWFWSWKMWWEWCWMMWGGFWKNQNNLTDAEKTALESMTDTEKQAFFDKKRTENEAKMEARDAVIDKLLDWTVLTDADKVIVEEIKKDRAEAKAQKAEMKEIRTLMEKQKAWTTLTSDEQAKIDAFKSKIPWKWKMRWFNR